MPDHDISGTEDRTAGAPTRHTGRGTGDGTDIRFEPPALDDGRVLWSLARANGLDENSPYAYVMWCRDFAHTSVVARDGAGTVRGFVSGYVRPERPDTYFLWQVAVDSSFRGRRLGRRMIDHIGARITDWGLTHLEATVTPGNTASRALFDSFARGHGVAPVWTPLFRREHFPHEDATGHEPEELVRIGPLSRDAPLDGDPAANAGLATAR